jgi:hypothetical protein
MTWVYTDWTSEEDGTMVSTAYLSALCLSALLSLSVC